MATRNLFRKLLLLPLLAFSAGAIGYASAASADFGNPIRSAFLYQMDGSLLNPGAGGSYGHAPDINLAGPVVGGSEWSTEPQDLIDSASGWALTGAQDINVASQVPAPATACRAGECATVRLDRAVPPVPEPRAWGLLLVGLMLVASRRRASNAEQTFS